MKKFIAFTIILFYCIAAFCAEAEFDVQNANKQLDDINISLSIQNLKLENFVTAVEKLEQLNENAIECVNIAEKELNLINKLLNETQIQTGTDTELTFLKQRKSVYIKSLNDCKLFEFRSNDAISAYRKIIDDLSKSKLISQTITLFEAINKITIEEVEQVVSNIPNSIGLNLLGKHEVIFLLTLLIFGIFAGYILQYHSSENLKIINIEKQRIRAIHLLTMRRFAYPVVLIGLATLYLNLHFINTIPTPIIIKIFNYIFSYLVALYAFRAIIAPPGPTQTLLPSPHNSCIRAYKAYLIHSTVYLCDLSIGLMLKHSNVSKAMYAADRSIFTILLTFTGMWLIIRIIQLPFYKKFTHLYKNLLYTFALALTSSVIFFETNGYHHLSYYLLHGFIVTTVVFISLWLFLLFSNFLFKNFFDERNTFANKIKSFFGLQPKQIFIELFFSKVVIYFAFLCIIFLFLLHVWGVSSEFITSIRESILSGFTLGNITINPARISLGIIVFVIINLIARALSQSISKRYQFKQEASTQVAFASIIFYIGFTTAVVMALFISGFNFTGLAIIAGALSVGIGLGLQSIVNNFVAGIIILLERQIKPGDRVIVGEIEGFVKRIRIRSTQVTTIAKEDVIIPNAELVSTKVTNFMYRDKLWRVICKVGVAYGSDIELVKKVLQQIADDHPDVLKQPPNETLILFQEFADSCLLFEMWCIINDVNKKFIVLSELNYAVDRAFKENNITIAFPQLDLHLPNNSLIDTTNQN